MNTIYEHGRRALNSEFTWVGSTTLSAGIVYSYPANGVCETLRELEIQNQTGGDLYYFPVNAAFSAVTAGGMVIDDGALFSVTRKIDQFSLGSVSGGDVKLFGHY